MDSSDTPSAEIDKEATNVESTCKTGILHTIGIISRFCLFFLIPACAMIFVPTVCVPSGSLFDKIYKACVSTDEARFEVCDKRPKGNEGKTEVENVNGDMVLLSGKPAKGDSTKMEYSYSVPIGGQQHFSCNIHPNGASSIELKFRGPKEDSWIPVRLSGVRINGEDRQTRREVTWGKAEVIKLKAKDDTPISVEFSMKRYSFRPSGLNTRFEAQWVPWFMYSLLSALVLSFLWYMFKHRNAKVEALKALLRGIVKYRYVLFIGFLLVLSITLVQLCHLYVFCKQTELQSILSVISSTLLVFFLLLLSCRIRTLGMILLPIISIPLIIEMYLWEFYGFKCSYLIFCAILETDWNEASDHLTLANISMMLGLLALIALLVFAGHKLVSQPAKASKKTTIILIASLVLFAGFAGGAAWEESLHPVKKGDFKDKICTAMYWPLSLLYAHIDYTVQHYQDSSFHWVLQLPDGHVPASEEDKAARPEDMIVVLMIGESMRNDHMAIGGYKRPTTPNLSKRMDNLVFFKETCAFGIYTRISVVGMLTDAELNERLVRHSSFINLLNKDDVETITCMTNASPHDSFLRLLTRPSKHQYFIDVKDESHGHVRGGTVDVFDKAVDECKDAKRLFYVVYDLGAHAFFHSLPQNKKFLPDNVTSSTARQNIPALINRYDNIVLEVEWELDMLIKKLEGLKRPVVFFYVGDHGESLGEKNKIGRCVAKQVYSPAMFMWCSDEFKQTYPEKFAALKANEKKAVAHDHVMHTVVSLLGYQRGEVFKPELDLTSPDAKAVPVPKKPSVLNTPYTALPPENAK